MAIDIKQLHIGSHVIVNGERVRVCGITRRKIGYHATGKPGEHLRYARLNEVEPIPITPDLLEELGFEITSCTRRITYTKGSEYEDLWIEFKNIEDRWDVFVRKDNLDSITVCRHLHEAEAFLRLHGVELIKD